jgi:hypothetical protein
MKAITKLLLVVTLSMVPQNFLAKPAPVRAVAPEPTIHFKGYYASDKAQKGRVVRAAVVLEIPDGITSTPISLSASMRFLLPSRLKRRAA